MIKVIASSYPKEDAKDEMLKLVQELADEARREPGNISYEMYQSVSDPGELAFVETWESQEALDAHTRTEHFARIAPKIDACQTQEMETKIYTLLI
jgi:quinol monooxygenase YgiN